MVKKDENYGIKKTKTIGGHILLFEVLGIMSKQYGKFGPDI